MAGEHHRQVDKVVRYMENNPGLWEGWWSSIKTHDIALLLISPAFNFSKPYDSEELRDIQRAICLPGVGGGATKWADTVILLGDYGMGNELPLKLEDKSACNVIPRYLFLWQYCAKPIPGRDMRRCMVRSIKIVPFKKLVTRFLWPWLMAGGLFLTKFWPVIGNL